MKIFWNILAWSIGIVVLLILLKNLRKVGSAEELKANQDSLDHEMQQFGRELEKLSYDDLKEFTKQKAVFRERGGRKFKFWFCPELEKDGDLFVLIEVLAENFDTLDDGTPTYTFWKRKDNTVYHGEDV